MNNLKTGNKNFTDSLLNLWNQLQVESPDTTLWDAFIVMVGDKAPTYMLYLKADIDILKYVAQGSNIMSIHRRTGIPSKAIRNVVFTWGVTPLEETLDFDALLVYNSGMRAETLAEKMNDLLPIPMEIAIYGQIIANIERYNELNTLIKEDE